MMASDTRNLNDAFSAARNAYPRPVWLGTSIWRLVEHTTNTDLLILSEQPRRQSWSEKHDFYSIPKREMERALRLCPVCAFFGRKPQRLGFDYGRILDLARSIPCCKACVRSITDDSLTKQVLAWLAKQPQERKGA